MERAPLIVLALCSCALAQAPPPSLDDAIARMEAGDLPGAERLLRAHASDADALGLLAIVLDQEQKFDQAGEVYLHALQLTPRSPALLNNYGNHLLATGRSSQARLYFLRVIGADPSHINAHVQLARISLEQHDPQQAFSFLAHVPPSALQAPDVALLRMQVLYSVHRTAEADSVLQNFTQPPFNDAAIGKALASVGQFEKAETYLARGLKQQPENVDLLYALAAVQASLNQDEKALALLAHAAQLAPDRADIQKLLARTAGQLGFAGDAVQAWTRYTELAPADDDGRRERAFAQTALAGDTSSALAGLRWFVLKHPGDAVGHYELGTALAANLPDPARAELDRALALNPELTAAHVARGILSYRQGKFESALSDFRSAALRDPKNAGLLDRIGETYLALNQPQTAVSWLRRAVELAPAEPRILLHLGRALAGSGQSEESAKVLARFRELGADKSTLPRAAGVIDFLNLSPTERLARYRAGVEKTVRDHPENADAQVRYLGLVLEKGDLQEADAVTRTILALHPSPALLVETADILIEAEQFPLAKQFIEASEDKQPLLLDLGIATFYLDGVQSALPILDEVGVPERNGDYYLVRALVLSAAGKTTGGHQALVRALALHPVRPALYRLAVQSLLRAHQRSDAQLLLEQALKRFPDTPGLADLQAEADKKSRE